MANLQRLAVHAQRSGACAALRLRPHPHQQPSFPLFAVHRGPRRVPTLPSRVSSGTRHPLRSNGSGILNGGALRRRRIFEINLMRGRVSGHVLCVYIADARMDPGTLASVLATLCDRMESSQGADDKLRLWAELARPGVNPASILSQSRTFAWLVSTCAVWRRQLELRVSIHAPT